MGYADPRMAAEIKLGVSETSPFRIRSPQKSLENAKPLTLRIDTGVSRPEPHTVVVKLDCTPTLEG